MNERVLEAVEQYRKELEAVRENPATRYFPTHNDLAVERMREFHQVGAELWADSTNRA